LTPVVQELHFEKHVGILEKSLFETYDQKLTVLEEFLDHQPDVLGVGEVQGRIDFVQNI
jgi:hypothetical protein